MLFDVESGRRRELSVKGSGWIFSGGVVVAPDGRTLFSASREGESDIWMLERSQSARGKNNR